MKSFFESQGKKLQCKKQRLHWIQCIENRKKDLKPKEKEKGKSKQEAETVSVDFQFNVQMKSKESK